MGNLEETPLDLLNMYATFGRKSGEPWSLADGWAIELAGCGKLSRYSCAVG
jgi:hypothetical protein